MWRAQRAIQYCPRCGMIVPEGSEFCPYCGCPLREFAFGEVICPRCGENVSREYMYCPKCGYALRQVGKVPRLGERPKSITAASILFYVFGCLSMGMSIFGFIGYLFIATALTRGVEIMPALEFLKMPTQALLGLMLIALVWTFVLGGLEIVAGYYLWKASKSGGYLGLGLCVISLASEALSLMFFGPLYPMVESFMVIINLLLIALILAGWRQLL